MKHIIFLVVLLSIISVTLAKHRFVNMSGKSIEMIVIREDTIFILADTIPPPTQKINWDSVFVDVAQSKGQKELNDLYKRVVDLEDNFSMMQGAKDLNQMKELLRQKK